MSDPKFPPPAAAEAPLTLAVPKGRILKVLVPLLAQAGIAAEGLLGDDRRLVRESDDGRRWHQYGTTTEQSARTDERFAPFTSEREENAVHLSGARAS